MQENIDIEFKELDRKTGKLPGSISKAIVSFANTEGGELYIGVRDDGTTVGVDNPDDIMTRVSNVVHDTILPDIMPFIQIRAIERDGKNVVKTTVSVGTERPYYLAKDGLNPKGVYIRRGSACVPLNETGIRQMIMDTSGKSFEESRSLNQELTFKKLGAELAAHNMDFGLEQMKTLKMIATDGLYNNLALLLSDQCTHTIRVAVFQGNDNAVFRERKEFSGSLLKQLEDAYKFIDFHNKTEAEFRGLRRKDYRDYPPDALREALLNSIIHRDYLFSGSTIINMYKDHIEFISLGGLISGLSMQAILMGASQSRNPNLASVFYRLNLVESYGTGVRKIMRLYNGFDRLPVFKTAEGVFTVEMQNRNEKVSETDTADAAVIPDKSVVTEKAISITLNSEIKEKIIDFAKEKDKFTRKDIEEAFQISSARAYKCLKQLCEEKKIIQILNGNRTLYVLAKKIY